MDIWRGELEQAAALVGELARRDVSGLSHDDLLAALDLVARVGRLSGALQARFAGEIARRSAPVLPGGGLARAQGFGTAAALVAGSLGVSGAQARRSIEAGQALIPDALPPDADADADAGVGVAPAPRYPAIAAAVLDGDLSTEAAALIASGLEDVTDSLPGPELHALEEKLVRRAAGIALHELRRLVASAVARADVAAVREREERQHEERFVAWTEDHRGMVTLSGRLDAVTFSPIRTAIEQVVTHDFRARRDQDPLEADRRSVGQMRADALALLCRHAVGCDATAESGVRTTVVVRVDARTLEAGEGLAELDGAGAPISVAAVERLAGDADVVRQVMGAQGEVLDLGRRVRLFNRAQRLALLERDGGCAKCHAPPEHCEAHHIRWWDRGGGTDLANGVMLCTRCHHDVHRQGWEIRATPSRVEFVPPAGIDPERTPRLGGVAALRL